MSELRIKRYPQKLTRQDFYPLAYYYMYLTRQLENRMIELFQKGYIKGTVTISSGNEATAIGMALPLRPCLDVVTFMHRDIASHLIMGVKPYTLLCQYMANRESPTHGCEGNVHHGDVCNRRFPMISHLGKMFSLAVGGTWAARRKGDGAFGLTIIGDGSSSTGEFHEALNIASIHHVPVIFLIQNNHYSFSTPTEFQYNCASLSDRAHGYGIKGVTIDGTDPWEVYSTVFDALAAMDADPAPTLIECDTIRLHGHAVYDKAEYITPQQREEFLKRDPVPKTRRILNETYSFPEADIAAMEHEIDSDVQKAIDSALKVPRPDAQSHAWTVYADSPATRIEPFRAKKIKNGDAVNHAQDYILAHNPGAVLLGLDVGTYGSAFKTSKGLIKRYGPERVMDMPLSESGIMGFALGASQVGIEPIVEFQFADFSTETVTQLGLNTGTWFTRSSQGVPMLVRLPCGGGLTLGQFHSGEYEGLWSLFPGLKLLYPSTPQETFEALVAGFYDRNPCLVFENKLLYWNKTGDIDFDGDLKAVWRPRRYTEGGDLTIVAIGAMIDQALSAAAQSGYSVDVWNPFVLKPLDLGPVMESVEKTGKLIVVQESGESQGIGNRIISLITQECFSFLKNPPKLIAAPDAMAPFAPELEACFRPNAQGILETIKKLLGER
ncbi:transketolase [bacterium]|nr:transketolase [bacterium]